LLACDLLVFNSCNISLSDSKLFQLGDFGVVSVFDLGQHGDLSLKLVNDLTVVTLVGGLGLVKPFERVDSSCEEQLFLSLLSLECL